MAARSRSPLRRLCDSLDVLSNLRNADDRVWVTGPQAFVAHKGWGLYRYWMGESRGATVRWVDGVLTELERVVHGGEAARLRDVNRLLSGAHVFRKGLLRLGEIVYAEDRSVRDALTRHYGRCDIMIRLLRDKARALLPIPQAALDLSLPVLPLRDYGDDTEPPGPL
jgi:hypothetical protein